LINLNFNNLNNIININYLNKHIFLNYNNYSHIGYGSYGVDYGNPSEYGPGGGYASLPPGFGIFKSLLPTILSKLYRNAISPYGPISCSKPGTNDKVNCLPTL
jgi:hypothetical protein